MASCEIIELPEPVNYYRNRNSYKQVSVVVLSDTHNNHEKYEVPDGDILLHCGDFTKKSDWRNSHCTREGTCGSVENFNNWLGTLPHPHKIVIHGNHELGFNMLTKRDIQSKLLTNCRYLQNEMIVVEGISIYGCPWSFYETEPSKWTLIPAHIDILMTHEPPENILDLAYQPNIPACTMPCSVCDNQVHGAYGHWGSKSLATEIQRRIKPKVHCFGHVHDSPGYKYTPNIGTMFINAAGIFTKKCFKFTYYVDKRGDDFD